MPQSEIITAANHVENLGEPELEPAVEYVADVVKSQFVELILAGMEKKGLSKTDLAHKLKTSPQYISKIINETANFTIESMAAISCALGMKLEIKMQEIDGSMLSCGSEAFDSIYPKDRPADNGTDELFGPSPADLPQPPARTDQSRP